MIDAPPSELTIRALLIGGLLGGVLAVVNTYVGLKTGIIESGHFFSVLIGFAVCSLVAGAAGRTSPLELNVIQTVATAAAGMVNVLGISGAISGMVILGHRPSIVTLVAFGATTAMFGLLMAGALRTQLLVDHSLPFPTGQATAELISTISSDGTTARQARPMLASAALSALLVWLRDGRPAVVPGVLWLPAPYPDAAATAVGIAVSPLLVGVGLLVRTSTATWIAVGSVLAWLGLGPWLVGSGRATATYNDLSSWLVWPGVALVLGGSVAALVRRRVTRRMYPPARRAVAVALAVAVAALGLGHALGAPAAAMVAGLVLAPVLAWVGARVAAESDVALAGPLGAFSQVGIAPFASTPAGVLVPASVTSGVVAHTMIALWALKAGMLLGASPRRQWICLAVGSAVGLAVAPAMFAILIRAYELGGPDLPAPFAATFAASSKALLGGAGALPSGAGRAALIALIAGIVLSLAAGPGRRRFMPSPTALGIGFLLPLAYALPIALGGIAGALAVKLRPAVIPSITPVAIGAIIGEALLGTLVAGLRIAGVL